MNDNEQYEWYVVSRKNGVRVFGPDTSVDDAHLRHQNMRTPATLVVARWDADNLRWIEAPERTIMVELPVGLVRMWATAGSTSALSPACRAALEREGLTS